MRASNKLPIAVQNYVSGLKNIHENDMCARAQIVFYFNNYIT